MAPELDTLDFAEITIGACIECGTLTSYGLDFFDASGALIIAEPCCPACQAEAAPC